MRRVGLAGSAGSGVGKSAIRQAERSADTTAEVGGKLAAERAAHIKEQVEMFRKRLEEFAVKYRAEINKDPQFRHHFIRMAKCIGVDPLSSSKGWMAENLGIGLGTFYADLAVQVAHVCVDTRPVNGGLISMQELLRRLNAMRSSVAGAVNEDDVRRALSKLSTLGGGYREVEVAKVRCISSVPELLSDDTATALSALGAAPEGFATAASLARTTGWSGERCERALRRLLRDGVTWLDMGVPGEQRYYAPSLIR